MHRYQATQRSETNLVKKISETFGSSKEIVLAFGNWSRTTQMRGLPSSPVVGIKRVLSKHFAVVTVDEFRTTGTCCKCGNWRMQPVPERAIDVDGHKKENRSLRRCPNEDCKALFSRDYNAAINIAEQARHLQEHGTPHPRFSRSTKLVAGHAALPLEAKIEGPSTNVRFSLLLLFSLLLCLIPFHLRFSFLLLSLFLLYFSLFRFFRLVASNLLTFLAGAPTLRLTTQQTPQHNCAVAVTLASRVQP